MHVLVGYATAHGSTRSVAERIAARLRELGQDAEARTMSEVREAGGYDAFVLGSAVHNQAWLPEAGRFVGENRAALGARPVWLFSVGMPAALRGPWRRLAPLEEPRVLGELAPGFPPRGHRLFSGVVRREQLPLLGRVVFRLMGCRYGDFRDWAAVDAWAAVIADELATA